MLRKATSELNDVHIDTIHFWIDISHIQSEVYDIPESHSEVT